MAVSCWMPTIQYSAGSASFFKLNDLHISTSLSSVMMDMSRDSILDRNSHTCVSVMCRMLSTGVRRRRKFGEVSCPECTGQGNDFDSNGKNEN